MFSGKDQIYLKKHEVVLGKSESGRYEPVAYMRDGKWYAPVDGDIIQDWIVYVRLAMKTPHVITGEMMQGGLYAYQWGMSINIINTMIDKKTKFFDVELSRRAGKTFLMEHINSFLTVFGRRYKPKLKGGEWVTMTISHKTDSVKKNFRPIRKNIKKAVDIYNNLYGTPNHTLVYGNYEVGDEKKSTIDKDSQLEIHVITGNKSQEWAQIYALTAQANQDGYGACMIFADESILIDSKDFMRSIVPFVSENGGSIIVTSIASTNPACLQFSVHHMEDSIKFIYSHEDVYKLMKLTDPEDAEVFRNSVEVQIMATGGHHSTEAQTNYYMNWEITNGRFVTRDQLRKNNILSTDIGDINYNADFIIAGLDLSTVNDYTVLTIAEAYKKEYTIDRYGKTNFEDGYEYYIKEIICYNHDRMRMDADILAKKIAMDLKKYKVDMFTSDCTGTQEAQNQTIFKECKKLDINTLMIPFNFAGVKNKVNMMSYLEAMMFSNRCKLPKEEYKNYNKEYRLLYDELLVLRKEKEDGKQNIQYKAPKGKTDDFCMSLALCVYTIQNIMNLKADRKQIELGTIKYIPKLNKFKLLSDTTDNRKRMGSYAHLF